MTRLAGILALLLAIVVLLVPSARAEDSIPEKDIDAIFRKLDTNKDGRLSKDEFLKIADRFRDRDRARSQLGQTFDKLDPTNQGLTRDQFRMFAEVRHKKKAEDAKRKGEK